MSKNIREKIAHAIQTTFRLSPQKKQTSSTKSNAISCCSIQKPDNYGYIPYEYKQVPKNNDYIDLSECHSWSLSYSKDSGVSSYENSYQLESTRIFSDDSSLLSTFTNISPIPHYQKNISHDDITTLDSISTSFKCCHCQCHHNQKEHQQKRTIYKIYPFIV